MKKLILLLSFLSICLSNEKIDEKLLQNKCLDGCKNSCLKLANYYQHTKQNAEKSMPFYKALCAKEVEIGCKNLSDIYKYDNTLQNKNLETFYKNKTFIYTKKNCNKNNANSCFKLGSWCEDGYFSCKKSIYYHKAFLEYKKECKKDDYNCYELANMYFYGISTKTNHKKAINLYKKACQNDEKYSCYNLGKLYEDGIYVKKDINTSKKYYQKSCKIDKTLGCDESLR